MLTVALLLPVAVGQNVTLILQLAPPLMPVPQSLVTAKSPALVPVILRLDRLRRAVSVLVRIVVLGVLVVLTAWVPNDNVFGLKLGTVPVPLRTTACGLAGSASLMTKNPLRVPLAEGLKVTHTKQVSPAASEG